MDRLKESIKGRGLTRDEGRREGRDRKEKEKQEGSRDGIKERKG